MKKEQGAAPGWMQPRTHMAEEERKAPLAAGRIWGQGSSQPQEAWGTSASSYSLGVEGRRMQISKIRSFEPKRNNSFREYEVMNFATLKARIRFEIHGIYSSLSVLA